MHVVNGYTSIFSGTPSLSSSHRSHERFLGQTLALDLTMHDADWH